MKSIFNSYFILFILLFNSCVSRSDYNKLKKEKLELETQIEELSEELNEIKSNYSKTVRNNFTLRPKRYKIRNFSKDDFKNLNKKEEILAGLTESEFPYIPESIVKKYINDYYSFYETDYKYRNVQIRRISSNEFSVSIEECPKKLGHVGEMWNHSLKTIIIYDDGYYDYRLSGL